MATEQFVIDILVRGGDRSARDIDRIGKSASQVRKTLAFLRSALVVVAAFRVFGTLSKALASFAQSMSTVKAVTQATAVQFSELRDRAKELGATTRFSANEAAEGMVFLGRAGFDANEILATIGDTLNLAQAGALDLGRAADIASNVLQGFGLDVSEVTRVVDVLAFTANSANTNVEQMGIALKVIAPIASGLGVSLEDVSASLAILGNAGIQASIAGSGFKRVLIDLESPGSRLRKILKAVGLEAKDIRPSLVGVSTALKKLREAGVGAALASEAFGKRGGFVFATLARDVDEIDEFRTKLNDVNGVARETARIMDENLNGALLAVKSATEAVLLAFGDLGAETLLTNFLRGLADVLRAVAKNVDELVAALKILVTAFAIKKILLFAGALLKSRIAMLSLNRAIIANPFGVLLKGMGLIVTAATLVTVGLVGFQNQIKLTEDGSVLLSDALDSVSKVMKDDFTKAINSAGGEVSDFDAFVERTTMRVGLGFTRLVANVAGAFAVLTRSFGNLRRNFDIVRLLIIKGFNVVLNVLNKARALVGQEAIPLVDTKALEKSIADAGFTAKTLAQTFNETFDEVIKGTLVNAVERELQELQDAPGFDDPAFFKQLIPTPAKEAFPGKPIEIIEGDKSAKEVERLTDSLRSLEASVAPFLASLDAVAEAQKIINEATAKGIDLRISEEELITRIRREQLGAGQTVVQLAEQINVLARARMNNIISMEEEIKLTRDANIAFLEQQRGFEAGIERAFLKGTDAATNFAAQSERVITDAFKSAGDVLNNFFKTGELDAKSLITTLITLAAKLLTIKAIEAVGGGVGGIGGGGAASGIGAVLAQSVLGGIGGGFAQGGSFTVGKNNAVANLGAGTDNRLIAFRADDGEEVTVIPRNRAAPGGGMQIIQNINVRDADSFKRSQGQNLMRGQAALARVQRRR